ncbi:MAG: hypothetical protein ACI4WS_12265 [Oscillospiraceae bacterium]
MRKYISVLLSAALVTAACGCMSRSASQENSAPEERSTREETQPTAEPTADAPSTAEAPGHTTEPSPGTEDAQPEPTSDVVLLDFDGTPIDTTDPNTYTFFDNDGYWQEYRFDGFAWLAEPRGFAVVSTDGSIPDMPEFTPAGFKRYNTGDTICGLTITNAQTLIETSDGSSFFNGCRVEFDGTVETTGYLYYVTETIFLDEKGDLMFIPTAEGCTFPVLHYGVVASLSNTYETYFNEIRWGNEYDRQFSLGQYTGYSGEDWSSLIPLDGTPVKVKATVGNISSEFLNDSHKSGNGYYRGKILALELV